jgi:hypothetical protein
MGAEHTELIEHLKGVRHIVINACHGGFGLSPDAMRMYLTKAGLEYTEEDRGDRFSTTTFGPLFFVNGEFFSDREIARDDPILISVVRELGEEAPGRHAELKILTIPADVDWQIDEYDGWEWIAEKHRTWS